MRVHLGLITVLPEKAAWNKYSTRVVMYVCIVCIDEKRRERKVRREKSSKKVWTIEWMSAPSLYVRAPLPVRTHSGSFLAKRLMWISLQNLVVFLFVVCLCWNVDYGGYKPSSTKKWMSVVLPAIILEHVNEFNDKLAFLVLLTVFICVFVLPAKGCFTTEYRRLSSVNLSQIFQTKLYIYST